MKNIYEEIARLAHLYQTDDADFEIDLWDTAHTHGTSIRVLRAQVMHYATHTFEVDIVPNDQSERMAA